MRLASMESRPQSGEWAGSLLYGGAEERISSPPHADAAEVFEREWKVDAGLLFCLPNLKAYYEALGWQEIESPVLIEQPSGKIVSPLCVKALPLVGEGWSSGSIELGSLPW